MYIPIWTEHKRIKQLKKTVDYLCIYVGCLNNGAQGASKEREQISQELRKLRESHGKTLWKNKKGLKELFVWKQGVEEHIKRLEANELEGLLQGLAQSQNDNTTVLRRVEKIQNAMLLHTGSVATVDPASETSPDGLRYTIKDAGQPDNKS